METKPRKAIINLDWLDAEIENLRGGIRSGTYHKYIGTAKVDSADMAITLDLVRSKCEPIEESKEPATFLSKTCVNNWESNKYCSDENKCQMCQTK
jgi:hypothetical protein